MIEKLTDIACQIKGKVIKSSNESESHLNELIEISVAEDL